MRSCRGTFGFGGCHQCLEGFQTSVIRVGVMRPGLDILPLRSCKLLKAATIRAPTVHGLGITHHVPRVHGDGLCCLHEPDTYMHKTCADMHRLYAYMHKLCKDMCDIHAFTQ